MRITLIILTVSLLISCKQDNTSASLPYSVTEDSTSILYQKGWQQIMDYGQYGKAEITYRKALTYDSNFLVGKAVLGRLTRNLEERMELYDIVDKRKDEVRGDERLVLDFYQALVKYTNLKDQKSRGTAPALQIAMQIGEQNLKNIVHKYPEEVYLKSEYIEVIHSLYGAKVSLDTLTALRLPNQKDNPFLLGFEASLLSELNQYDKALIKGKQLAELLKDLNIPKPDAILADIYYKKKMYQEAKTHADKAYEIDPKNLDASRLKAKIDKMLNIPDSN